MKKVLILLLCVGVLGCKSKKPAPSKPAPIKAEKVAAADVDPAQKARAYDLGKRILMTCNTSRFRPFSPSEATPTVIKNTTEQRLTKTCLGFRLKYGDFRDLDLIEVIHDKRSNSNIYRYKALYEKKIANKELRVTMNDKNQVAAIKSLDWQDKFK